MAHVRHLRIIRPEPVEADMVEDPSTELEDVGLLAAIFAIAALPLASAIGGVGTWGPGTLGLGAVGVLWSGRELCGALVARAHGRRRT